MMNFCAALQFGHFGLRLYAAPTKISKNMQMSKHVDTVTLIFACGAEPDSDSELFSCSHVSCLRARAAVAGCSIFLGAMKLADARSPHARARTHRIVTCLSQCALHASLRSRTAADS